MHVIQKIYNYIDIQYNCNPIQPQLEQCAIILQKLKISDTDYWNFDDSPASNDNRNSSGSINSSETPIVRKSSVRRVSLIRTEGLNTTYSASTSPKSKKKSEGGDLQFNNPIPPDGAPSVNGYVRRPRSHTAPSREREKTLQMTEESRPKIRKHGSMRDGSTASSTVMQNQKVGSSTIEVKTEMSTWVTTGTAMKIQQTSLTSCNSIFAEPLPPITRRINGSLTDYRKSTSAPGSTNNMDDSKSNKREVLIKLRESRLALIRNTPPVSSKTSLNSSSGVYSHESLTEIKENPKEVEVLPPINHRSSLPPITKFN